MKKLLRKAVSVGASLALAGTMCGAGATQAFACENATIQFVNSTGVSGYLYDLEGKYAQMMNMKAYSFDIVGIDGSAKFTGTSDTAYFVLPTMKSGSTYFIEAHRVTDSSYYYYLLNEDGSRASDTQYSYFNNDNDGNILLVYKSENVWYADFYSASVNEGTPTKIKLMDDASDEDSAYVDYDDYGDCFYVEIGDSDCIRLAVEDGVLKKKDTSENGSRSWTLVDGTKVTLSSSQLVAYRPGSSTPVSLLPGTTVNTINNSYSNGKHILFITYNGSGYTGHGIVLILKEDGTLAVFNSDQYRQNYTNSHAVICDVNGELWVFDGDTGTSVKIDFSGYSELGLSKTNTSKYGSAYQVKTSSGVYYFGPDGKAIDLSAFTADGSTIKEVTGTTTGFGVITESAGDEKHYDVYFTDANLDKATAKHLTRDVPKEAGFNGDIYAELVFTDSTHYNVTLYGLDTKGELVTKSYGPIDSEGYQILLANVVRSTLYKGVYLSNYETGTGSIYFDKNLQQQKFIPTEYDDEDGYLVDYIYKDGLEYNLCATMTDGTKVFRGSYTDSATHAIVVEHVDVEGTPIVRNGYTLGYRSVSLQGSGYGMFEVAGSGLYAASNSSGDFVIVDANGNLKYDFSGYMPVAACDSSHVLGISCKTCQKYYFLQLEAAQDSGEDEPVVTPDEPVVTPDKPAVKPAVTPAAPAAKKVTNVTINKSTVTAKMIKAAAKKGATTITLGPKVKKVSKNAFKGTKVTKVIVKTKKLKASKVKGCFKSSKVKTVKVKVGSKKLNKKFVTKYKKIFTKKNCGKKVTVKK